MITIKNVKTMDGEITDYEISSSSNDTIEANQKLLLSKREFLTTLSYVTRMSQRVINFLTSLVILPSQDGL